MTGDPIFDQDNDIAQEAYAEATKAIVDMMKNNTDWAKRGLKGFSMVFSIPYCREELVFFKENKIHINRGRAKDNQKALESIAKSLAASIAMKQQGQGIRLMGGK